MTTLGVGFSVNNPFSFVARIIKRRRRYVLAQTYTEFRDLANENNDDSRCRVLMTFVTAATWHHKMVGATGHNSWFVRTLFSPSKKGHRLRKKVLQTFRNSLTCRRQGVQSEVSKYVSFVELMEK